MQKHHLEEQFAARVHRHRLARHRVGVAVQLPVSTFVAHISLEHVVHERRPTVSHEMRRSLVYYHQTLQLLSAIRRESTASRGAVLVFTDFEKLVVQSIQQIKAYIE